MWGSMYGGHCRGVNVWGALTVGGLLPITVVGVLPRES